MTSNALDNMNAQQAAAVQAVEGPVLVLAGPGSGKTRVLTRRIAFLIDSAGVAPWNILAVTFTNKAAREMRERVEAIFEDKFGKSLPGEPPRLGGLTIGTFHSLCARVLRVETEAIGFARNWVIYDTPDQHTLIRSIIAELNLDEKRHSPAAVQAYISRMKNELIPPGEATTATYFENVTARVYARYQEALHANNAMDFDDLLMRTVMLFRENEAVLRKYQQKWQYLLVDEFQDTNSAQYELVRLLVGPPEGKRNLFCVGDEDQCLVEGTLVATPQGPVPIEVLAPGDTVIAAAGHGSTAHAAVDRVFRREYVGVVYTLTTESGRTLAGTPEHCLFARFKPRSGYHYVYLMYSRRLGYRIGRTGSIRTNGAREYPGFEERLRQERGDAIWLIRATQDAGEAAYWETLYSARYGLPTACFYAEGRSLALTSELIEKLYHSLDTASAAQRLADDHHLSLQHPHHMPQATIRNGSVRKSISLTMFGSVKTKRGGGRWRTGGDPWHLHELSICSSDDGFRSEVSSVLKTKAHKSDYWAARSSHGNYDLMDDTLLQLREASRDAQVFRRARLTSHVYDFMPMSHIQPGAMIPFLESDGTIVEEMVAAVSHQPYAGHVYDLSVPTYRNYIAGGIVVHNSVYRFRGADYRNVRLFRETFPDARVILLEQNYRSTQTILDVANAVISNNRNRTPKQLHTDNGQGVAVSVYEAYNESEEASFICDEIEKMRQAPSYSHGDIAVMYRTNAQSRAVEEAFVRRNIKYRLVGGTRFYERKEVKDAISFLRLVNNPADSVALGRILNTPPRGIGSKSHAELKVWAAAIGVSDFTALQIVLHGPESMSQTRGSLLPRGAYAAHPFAKRQVSAFNAFTGMAEGWMAALDRGRFASVADLLDRILADSGYADDLRDDTPEGEDRFANLQELRGVAAQYTAVTLGNRPEQTILSLFLEEVSLVSDADQVDDKAGAVTLLTLHTAKGLEYPVVFMVGMEEGILPHSRSLESNDPEDMDEERRLAYVGITRAKKRLYLVHAYHRSLWGSVSAQSPSRFLEEIPEHLLSGMVDKRARREASFKRATSWDDVDDGDSRGRNSSSRPQPRSPYTWGNPPTAGAAKSTSWSPSSGGDGTRAGQPAGRPGNSPGAGSGGRTPRFKRRDSVQHDKFGVGTVIESNLTRDDEEVTVAFPGVGIKKLLVSFAGLKKL